MSMQDPISDMFTRIRNAQMVSKKVVSMPHSKLKEAIAEVLKQEGFVGNLIRQEEGQKPTLSIELKYHENRPVISSLKRVSRPGLRIYKGSDELPEVKNGMGIAIISTARGMMPDREARKKGLGGEVICYID